MTQSATYSSSPVLGDGPVPALARNNGGDAPVLEPEEEPAGLRPEDGLIREAGEDGLKGIDGHTLGADIVDHRAEPDKQTFEIILTGLFDLGAVDGNVVEDKFLRLHQVFEIKAE